MQVVKEDRRVDLQQEGEERCGAHCAGRPWTLERGGYWMGRRCVFESLQGQPRGMKLL